MRTSFYLLQEPQQEQQEEEERRARLPSRLSLMSAR
jgi:hypothetical protein